MATVRLMKEFYFRDVEALVQELNVARAQRTREHIKVELYVRDVLATELMVRVSDLYIVAFKGRDRVYDVSEFGGENYNDLGMPRIMTAADLDSLKVLGKFQKGAKLETKIVTFAAIVVSEASRFQGVEDAYSRALVRLFYLDMAVLDERKILHKMVPPFRPHSWR